MELGTILLSAGFIVVVLVLIISGDSRMRNTNRIWEHRKSQPRIRTVGPCAVAVGVYKTYEDRKRLEKTYPEYTPKATSSE
ncbi:MAG: hypothetical protein ACW98U_16610 [Candidatus Thorarchaeota archaeon]|jgi:uncharacterized membrane protein